MLCVSGTDGAAWQVCFDPEAPAGDALRPLAALLLALARREVTGEAKNEEGPGD
jgi:hypothetical protein